VVSRLTRRRVYSCRMRSGPCPRCGRLQVPQNSNVVRDQIISFPRLRREGEEPVLFRRVEIWDRGETGGLVFSRTCWPSAQRPLRPSTRSAGKWNCSSGAEADAEDQTFVGPGQRGSTQVWTALMPMLVLKYLQLKSTFAWSLSNLARAAAATVLLSRSVGVAGRSISGPPALAGVHDDAQQLEITCRRQWTAENRSRKRH